MAFNSNVTFIGYGVFASNKPSTSNTKFQEGGAVTLFQSNIFFDGAYSLEHNLAKSGGAVQLSESKLYINGHVSITNNTVIENGGGIYLSNSELNCQQKSTLVLSSNTATLKGGGIHAISSSVKATATILELFLVGLLRLYDGSILLFTGNMAKMGGGLSMESNAKLYTQKYDVILTYFNILCGISVYFINNTADYGGAVFVDDDANSGTCASSPRIECFFQVLHGYPP